MTLQPQNINHLNIKVQKVLTHEIEPGKSGNDDFRWIDKQNEWNWGCEWMDNQMDGWKDGKTKGWVDEEM